MRELTLLAAEHDSPWIEWVDQRTGDEGEIVVVLQQRQETAGEFRARVAASLERALKRGAALRELVVLTNDGDDQRASDEYPLSALVGDAEPGEIASRAPSSKRAIARA
jgi:hypothetical protein